MVIRSFQRLKRFLLRTPLISGLALLVVILAVLELTNTTHIFHKKKLTISNIPSNAEIGTNNQTSSSSSSQTTTPQSQAQPETKAATATPPSSQHGAAPAAPSGQFVSYHSPDSSTSEVSTCTTSPGSQCYIEFAKGSVVKKLEAKITDGSGSASWSWNIASAGLSSGSWKITAVASLNGQTSTTDDPRALEVQ